jgi:hypothetical protein
MFHQHLSDANEHGGFFGGRFFLVVVLAGRLCDGLLCSISTFLMQTSTVVSSEDDSSWWLFLLVDCVMVFYVPSASF